MILGAGRGERLAGLGLGVPKILVDIGGEPLLTHQLRYLDRQGVRHVVVNAHDRADQVLGFAAARTGNPELTVVVEENLLGTAGGVRNALDVLGKDPFVVLYGDVLFDVELAEVLKTHRSTGAAATVAAYQSPRSEGKGTIEVDDRGAVVAFRESHDQAGPGLINAGLYVLEPAFVARTVPAGVASDFGYDVFPAALQRGERISLHRLPRPVLDIGTPSALRQAQSGRW